MKKVGLELIVGIFVIAAISALIFLALRVSGLTSVVSSPGYSVTANFENIGSLKNNAPVTIGGVKVGQVTSITLDPATFQAVVTIHIFNTTNQIPIDTSASILTAGLLGANYIGLTPGYDSEYLQNGGVIKDTHPALILEQLISQLVFQLKK